MLQSFDEQYWEKVQMNEIILKIVTDYMQEENLLSKEESQRFQKIWRKEG